MTSKQLAKMFPNGITLDGAYRLLSAIVSSAYENLSYCYCRLSKYLTIPINEIPKSKYKTIWNLIIAKEFEEHWYYEESDMYKLCRNTAGATIEGYRIVDNIREERAWNREEILQLRKLKKYVKKGAAND